MKIYRVKFSCSQGEGECFCRDEFGLIHFLKHEKFSDTDSVVHGFRWTMENMDKPYSYDDGYTLVSVESKIVW